MPEVVPRTHVGRERDRNEDSILEMALPDIDGHLLVVADGMGGHQAGDVASQTAVEALEDEVAGAFPADRDRRAVVVGAIEAANDRIHQRAEEDGIEGMGTTVVAAVIEDGTALVANVGDSRAYVVDGGAEQVTVDQNLAREMVAEGALDEQDLDDHPHRHVLSQALGSSDEVDPEFFERDLDGGTLLLCSDGLPEEVDDGAIADIVESSDTLEAAGDRLVERANENGGSDNVSAVLYRDGQNGDEGSGDDDDGTENGGRSDDHADGDGGGQSADEDHGGTDGLLDGVRALLSTDDE